MSAGRISEKNMVRTMILTLSLCIATSVAADDALTKLPIGVSAPEFSFQRLDGSKTPTLRSLRGKVVVLDFWASWCNPCVRAIPHMDELKAELKNDPVQFFSVTYEPKGKAVAFLAQHPMTTTVGIDDDLKTFTSYVAWGIPMLYLIDAHGKIASVIYPAKLTAAVVREVIAGKVPTVEQAPGWKDTAGAAKYFREQLIEDRKNYKE